MKAFNCKDAALQYAVINLGKYESEIVNVNGKKTLVCSTSLPLEERFRNSIEEVVSKFFKEMNYENEDAVCFIGAEMSEQLINMIKDHTPIGIACAYQNF